MLGYNVLFYSKYLQKLILSCGTLFYFISISSSVISYDEVWVYGCNPGTKSHLSQWKTPTHGRGMNRSNVMKMLTVLFDYKGTVHHEYAPLWQTVDKKYYRDVVLRLRNALHCKKRQICIQPANGNSIMITPSWQLHHDNVQTTFPLQKSNPIEKDQSTKMRRDICSQLPKRNPKKASSNGNDAE